MSALVELIEVLSGFNQEQLKIFRSAFEIVEKSEGLSNEEISALINERLGRETA